MDIYRNDKPIKYFRTERGRSLSSEKNARPSGYVYKLRTKCYYSGHYQNSPIDYNTVVGYSETLDGDQACQTSFYRGDNWGTILYTFNFSDTVYETEWVDDGSGTAPGDGTNPGNGGGWQGSYQVLAGREFRIEPGTRDCLSQLLQNMTSVADLLTTLQMVNGYSNSPAVNNMVNFISTQGSWRVSIQEGNLPTETDPLTGNTYKPNASTRGYNGYVQVTFDSEYLNTATDLAVIRTLIHESIHAYFVYGANKTTDPGYAAFVENNNLLYDKSGSLQYNQADAQHQQMANKYVDDIAGMLYVWCNNNNIVSPVAGVSLMDYCKDMAWGGLSGTRAYTKFAQNKSRISQTILNEQNRNSRSTYTKNC